MTCLNVQSKNVLEEAEVNQLGHADSKHILPGEWTYVLPVPLWYYIISTFQFVISE